MMLSGVDFWFLQILALLQDSHKSLQIRVSVDFCALLKKCIQMG